MSAAHEDALQDCMVGYNVLHTEPQQVYAVARCEPQQIEHDPARI